MKVRNCIAALVCWVLTVSAMAAPVEISGVKLEEAIDISGSRLQLNGAGIRYKAIFKVLVAGLYLGKKVATPEEVFAAPGPKRMSLTFLRDVDSQEFSKQFMKGFADNTGADEVAKLAPALARMSQLIAAQKKFLTGDTLTIDWIPGSGTVIAFKGQSQGQPFRESELMNGLLAMWVGKNPADARLKDALLGKPS
jgi:hypothetical protein